MGAGQRLCSSGGITGAPRCEDERYRALFLELESQRGLARLAPPAGHRMRQFPTPDAGAPP